MRGTLPVAAVLLLVAACGTQVDTAKKTYPRTTVPAGQVPTEETGSGETPVARANDPAFTPEKLRVIQPCAVLDEDLLAELGQPEEPKHNDFNECANYMEDDEGRELNVTFTLGVTITNAVDANQNIGGLPALENTPESGDACFVTVVTSTSPNLGMTVQIGGNTDDLCEVGRTVMTSAVERIRSDSPTYDLANGTLIDLDPCAVLKPEALTEPLGGEAEPRPFNVHQCSWRSPTANLTVRLLLGYNPAGGDGSPVDLGGGVTGYQEKTVASAASCDVEWVHRPFAGDDVEMVSISYEKPEAAQGEDPCVNAQAIAKTLLSTLPKP